ncbi:MAG: glycosyltransferase [Solirubrobacterales bacterium]|nr:glycosyltransferase [Solirubrobacterales bacterium]
MTLESKDDVFNHAVSLITALHAEQVDVEALSFGPPLDPDQRQRLRGAAPIDFHETGVSLDSGAGLETAARTVAELEALHTPDLIHANSLLGGTLSSRSPVLVDVRSCERSRWRAVHGEGPPETFSRYSRLAAESLRQAALVVTPTATVSQAVRQEYPDASPEIRVIQHGGIAPRSEPHRKRAFAVGAGGLDDRAKNLTLLREAAPLMHHPVLIAGELEPGTERTTHNLAQPGQAHLLGLLSPQDLAWLFQQAAVFVDPAVYEPSGLTVLEAAQAGCALVLADIPSQRELWAGSAAFVDLHDPHALARVLDPLLDDPARAAALGLGAQRHAQQYSAGRMAGSYAVAYREACATRAV